MRRHATLPIAAALALVTLAGCASLEPFTAPEVTLVDLRFEDLTVFETSGTFTVRLSNENPEPIVVDGAAYKLYLGGLRVGEALSDERIELPRLGSAVYDVDVFINNVALVARLVTLGQERGLDYTIKGKLYVERPYGLRRLRFKRDGRIDFSADGARPAAAQPLAQQAEEPPAEPPAESAEEPPPS